MDAATCRAWITAAARLVAADTTRLTDLDAAIGDGDHGMNLNRGFQAALVRLDEAPPDTPGGVLALVGRTLISKTGGASGPLYGTAFRQAGKALGDAPEVPAERLAEALAAAVDSVRQLGQAVEGDKTMVDALAPAVRAFGESVAKGRNPADAARAAADAADEGRQATVPMQARKGRASYLGERSVGHEDPGAASAALILRALATVLAGEA